MWPKIWFTFLYLFLRNIFEISFSRKYYAALNRTSQLFV